jgi:hypothetical protein
MHVLPRSLCGPVALRIASSPRPRLLPAPREPALPAHRSSADRPSSPQACTASGIPRIAGRFAMAQRRQPTPRRTSRAAAQVGHESAAATTIAAAQTGSESQRSRSSGSMDDAVGGTGIPRLRFRQLSKPRAHRPVDGGALPSSRRSTAKASLAALSRFRSTIVNRDGLRVDRGVTS